MAQVTTSHVTLPYPFSPPTTMNSILRQVARRASSTRAFSTSTVARKDIVQDLYLREIKAYKPAPAAKDAHVGSVKKLVLPTAPHAPTLPADLASELAAYEATEPTAADAAPAAQAASTDGEAHAGPAEFLAFLEKDLPKPVHHH
ncbi:hypothetical protein D9619_009017 [Psilocybe cf. subviscida]|uniref:ATP synthase complex subunit H n=1 Tax=Psilocybe cf. subviscida TaxID=2480587 RepID=A0A8H5F9Y6_9AGAR|nr:hypothetical protein D9619_009017 [Psilocybe cf. subviscida]